LDHGTLQPEMIVPPIPARVEQAHQRAARWIDRCQVCALMGLQNKHAKAKLSGTDNPPC